MNNLQIEQALRSNGVTAKAFRGIFASDRLPSTNLRPGTFLIGNACPAATLGCHWYLLRITKTGKSIEVFDTSGLAPFNYSADIGRYVRRHRKRILFSAIPLQDSESGTCGQHTMVFSYLRQQGISRKKIYNLFDHVDLKKNDAIVLKMYRKIFVV